ncbi:MAG: hypothetical protein C0478_00405 [Planctomyces sp.]|nr:hypothetical protein [Planctomyces sp.]
MVFWPDDFSSDESSSGDWAFESDPAGGDGTNGEEATESAWVISELTEARQAILEGELDRAELLINGLCDAEVAPFECLELLAVISLRGGDLREAMGYACQLQDFANELACRRTQSRAASLLAGVYRQVGDFTSARRFQELAILSSESSDAFDLSNLSLDALVSGRVPLADQLAQAALSLQAEDGNSLAANTPDEAGADWGTLALVAMMNGDADETFSRLRLAWRNHRAAGDQLGMGLDQLHVATLCQVHGEHHRARRRLKKAIRHFERGQARPQLDEARNRLARLEQIIGLAEHNPEWN